MSHPGRVHSIYSKVLQSKLNCICWCLFFYGYLGLQKGILHSINWGLQFQQGVRIFVRLHNMTFLSTSHPLGNGLFQMLNFCINATKLGTYSFTSTTSLRRLWLTTSSVTIMPFTLNYLTTGNQWQYTQPAAEATEAPTVTDRRRMSHYRPGTENKPYYNCKWCSVEVKNTYFKYIKHIGACPMMKLSSRPANMDYRPYRDTSWGQATPWQQYNPVALRGPQNLQKELNFRNI